MRCVKCKKEKKRFDYHKRICNMCYKRRENKYFAVRFGIKKPSKGTQRRERIKRNGGFFTANEWLNLKKKYGFRCLRCGRKEPDIKLQADHIIPVYRGGTSWIDNIQCLCAACNGQKGTKIIDYRGVVFDDEEDD